MGEGKGATYWIYWGATSMVAAAIGGLLLPWLLKTDPFSFGERFA